ncbi:hypothetical protein [Spirosoma arcticum]
MNAMMNTGGLSKECTTSCNAFLIVNSALLIVFVQKNTLGFIVHEIPWPNGRYLLAREIV